MAIVQADDAHPLAKPHNGKVVTRVRAVTPDDGEAYDVARGKTLCQLDDSSQVIFWNTELQPSAGEV